MIKFKLYSKKSVKDMTDDEVRAAKYKNTGKIDYVGTGAKVGAAAGALNGLRKSLGRRGPIGTAISVGWNATKGSMAGAGIGAATGLGMSALGYSGKKIANTSKAAKEKVEKEVKKFSKYTDTPEKRAGLVAGGTLAGAGLGAGIGVENAIKHRTGKSLVGSVTRDARRAIANREKGVSMFKAAKDSIKHSKEVLGGSKATMNAIRNGARKGARVGGLAAAALGLTYAMNKRDQEKKDYNDELRARKLALKRKDKE